MNDQLIKLLKEANPNDDNLFHQLVKDSVQTLGVDERFLAERFGMSVPSVRRWLLGTTRPHPAMRPPVYKVFADLLENKTP